MQTTKFVFLVEIIRAYSGISDGGLTRAQYTIETRTTIGWIVGPGFLVVIANTGTELIAVLFR